MSQPCPICGQYHEYLIRNFHEDLDQPLIETLQAEVPGWQPDLGACSRCIDQASIEVHFDQFKGMGEPTEVNGFKILPIGVRLQANENYTGKGVTICFIDSGFYLHPDLVSPENRILKIMDITAPDRDKTYFGKPHDNAWHGTMTSVVCAGNGFLSDGIYKGLASDARLVLLKVMDDLGAISGQNITRALEWAIEHREEFQIKIINLSVTDDEVESFHQSAIDQAIQRAIDAGIIVVAAAGNDPRAPLKAPANSPHAITVGGLDDRNTLDPMLNTLYHSTYGETIDALQKPDIIAPAIWIPAPILPDTPAFREAVALFDLYHSGEIALKAKLANLIHLTSLDRSLIQAKIQTIRETIEEVIGDANYVSSHYKHVDGTSFAAPIVCSIIAQLLEANPTLSPAQIREALLTTARTLPREEADRQGWGVVQPAHALSLVLDKPLAPLAGITPLIDYQRKIVEFQIDQGTAQMVTLTGDFLQWSSNGLPLKRHQQGFWAATLPLPASGTYRYKFIIDGQHWISDPRNLYRESDGFNGFNSKLIIH